MKIRTPIDRAVAEYCREWDVVKAHEPGRMVVNPETLTSRTSPEFQFRYIDISSVTKGTIDWNSVETITFRESPSRARRVVRPGDVLICTVRPLLGSHVAATWNERDGYVCSTGFAVIRSKGVLLAPFLAQLLFSDQVARQLVAWQCGTNYPAVNESDIRQLRLPVPTVPEQETIADILGVVDEVIDHVRVSADSASRAKTALLQRLLRHGLRGEGQKKTSVGWIPKSWSAVDVKRVVKEFQYGMSLPMHAKGEIAILRMGNIQAGEVRFSDLKYVSLSAKYTAPYLLRRGDILFNRTNSQELVGKIGIYRSDRISVFASYLIRLHNDPEQVDNYYLGQVLNSYNAQCRIKRYATPGVQQVNINATNLGKVLIPLPAGTAGLEEQREIAGILEQADQVIRDHREKLTALQGLKRALMQDLLSGTIQVADAGLKSEEAL